MFGFHEMTTPGQGPTPARSPRTSALLARVCDDLLLVHPPSDGDAAQIAVSWQSSMRRWVIILRPPSAAAAGEGCEGYVPLHADEEVQPAAIDAPASWLLSEARRAFGEHSTLQQELAAVVDGFGNINYYALQQSTPDTDAQ